MDKDILSEIAEQYPTFSKRQRAIANYIKENYDKAAFMTAGRLGSVIGVSESTVVRFAADMGYDGYPSMRKALQDMIRSRLTSVQRIQVAKSLINDNDILCYVISADIEKLQATVAENNESSFDAAVDAIIAAKNVYIVGMRTSTALSQFLGYYLSLLREGVHVVHNTEASDVYEQLIRVEPEDLFIDISFPRYTSQSASAIRYVRAKNVRTLAITDCEASPLCEYADLRLFAKSDMVSFLDSLVAPLSLINAIIVAVGTRLGGDATEIFDRLEHIWTEHGVYEHN